jgi:hypothetical protein
LYKRAQVINSIIDRGNPKAQDLTHQYILDMSYEKKYTDLNNKRTMNTVDKELSSLLHRCFRINVSQNTVTIILDIFLYSTFMAIGRVCFIVGAFLFIFQLPPYVFATLFITGSSCLFIGSFSLFFRRISHFFQEKNLLNFLNAIPYFFSSLNGVAFVVASALVYGRPAKAFRESAPIVYLSGASCYIMSSILQVVNGIARLYAGLKRLRSITEMFGSSVNFAGGCVFAVGSASFLVSSVIDCSQAYIITGSILWITSSFMYLLALLTKSIGFIHDYVTEKQREERTTQLLRPAATSTSFS